MSALPFATLMALEALVPIAQDEIRRRGGLAPSDLEWARAQEEWVCTSGGEYLALGGVDDNGGRRTDQRGALGRFAKIIAIMTWCSPMGVHWAGLHWHSECWSPCCCEERDPDDASLWAWRERYRKEFELIYGRSG